MILIFATLDSQSRYSSYNDVHIRKYRHYLHTWLEAAYEAGEYS